MKLLAVGFLLFLSHAFGGSNLVWDGKSAAEYEALFSLNTDLPSSKIKPDCKFKSIDDVVRANPNQKDQGPYSSCFLTNAERDAIHDYTNADFLIINKALRENRIYDLSVLKKSILNIISGMEKLNPYKGIVTRRLNAPKEVAESFKVGQVYTANQFLSTSPRPYLVGSIEFRILSKNCKMIAPFSNFSSELEVLCPPGTQFYIHSKIQSSEFSMTRIVMEEVGFIDVLKEQLK